MSLTGLLLLAAVLSPLAVRAQDGHYWSNQYGTRAELLGGAVVGSIIDLSSSYYNPGALAIMPDPSVLLSGQALAQEKITVRDSTGADTGLDQHTFGSAPRLFATLVPLSDQIFAFSVLTRQDFSLNTHSFSSIQLQLPSGPEPGTSEYYIDQDLSETWIGITWARRLREEMGFGITPYMAVRSNRVRHQRLAGAMDEGGEAAALAVVDYYQYTHYRLLFKAGLTWKSPTWTAGLTITTPSLGLGFLSGGEAEYTRTVVGVDLDADGSADNVVAEGQSGDVDSDYRSPLSIAVGFSIPIDANTIHVSAEWFNGVDRYSVLEGARIGGDHGLTLEQRLQQELRSIVNIGVGFERVLRQDLNVFGAFTSDLSALPDDLPAGQLSGWNLYHVTGGAAFNFRGLDLTGGLVYSFGGKDAYPLVDSPTWQPARSFQRTEFEVAYWRLKYVIGFAFNI